MENIVNISIAIAAFVFIIIIYVKIYPYESKLRKLILLRKYKNKKYQNDTIVAFTIEILSGRDTYEIIFNADNTFKLYVHNYQYELKNNEYIFTELTKLKMHLLKYVNTAYNSTTYQVNGMVYIRFTWNGNILEISYNECNSDYTEIRECIKNILRAA